MFSRVLVVLVLSAASPALAQLAPSNDLGVTAGHVRINATDVEAHARFWTAVGGQIIRRAPATMVQVPGMYVLLAKQTPTGGTAGSSLNHLGLYVKDLAASVAAWRAAGLTWEPRENPVNGQGFLVGPDDVRIEIYINAAIATPIQFHHLHLMVPDAAAAQRWYARVFGATPGQRLTFQTATVPGAEIVLGQTADPQAPTKGRSVDHIGFEVEDLEAFAARLRDAGMSAEGGVGASTEAADTQSLTLTDPWGTGIEVTQGLAATRARR